MADMTHMLQRSQHSQVLNGLDTVCSTRERVSFSRNSNAPLPRLPAVQLNPSIMNWMIANGEAVHRSPQAPARPLANMRMNLASHNQGNEVADVGGNHRPASQVRPVAHVRE